MSILYHSTGEPGLEEGRAGPGPFDQIVQQDSPGIVAPNGQPFPVGNGQAFPVNQRSPQHWTGTLYNVTGRAGKATRLLTSQKGRRGFLLIVPSTAPAFVYVDSNQETLISPGVQGFPVALGAGLSLESEDELWCVSATPGTDTQVAIAVTWG